LYVQIPFLQDLVNTSLIGWTSTGKPRVDKDSEVNTDVSLSNGGNRFIIGGVEKREGQWTIGAVRTFRHPPGRFVPHLDSFETLNENRFFRS